MTSNIRREAERRGRRAEAIAAIFLQAKGHRILEKRFRSRVGEIDLIARRGRHIAFIEVKERGSMDDAAWAVTPRQQARIVRAAQSWLARHPQMQDFEIGFDVILIAPWRMPRHIADAFQA